MGYLPFNMEDQTTFKKVINRDNFWLCVIKGCHPTSCTTRTDPWTYGPGYRPKPWCTGKQLPPGFNPCVLGSVRGLYL